MQRQRCRCRCCTAPLPPVCARCVHLRSMAMPQPFTPHQPQGLQRMDASGSCKLFSMLWRTNRGPMFGGERGGGAGAAHGAASNAAGPPLPPACSKHSPDASAAAAAQYQNCYTGEQVALLKMSTMAAAVQQNATLTYCGRGSCLGSGALSLRLSGCPHRGAWTAATPADVCACFSVALRS